MLKRKREEGNSRETDHGNSPKSEQTEKAGTPAKERVMLKRKREEGEREEGNSRETDHGNSPKSEQTEKAGTPAKERVMLKRKREEGEREEGNSRETDHGNSPKSEQTEKAGTPAKERVMLKRKREEGEREEGNSSETDHGNSPKSEQTEEAVTPPTELVVNSAVEDEDFSKELAGLINAETFELDMRQFKKIFDSINVDEGHKLAEFSSYLMNYMKTQEGDLKKYLTFLLCIVKQQECGKEHEIIHIGRAKINIPLYQKQQPEWYDANYTRIGKFLACKKEINDLNEKIKSNEIESANMGKDVAKTADPARRLSLFQTMNDIAGECVMLRAKIVTKEKEIAVICTTKTSQKEPAATAFANKARRVLDPISPNTPPKR